MIRRRTFPAALTIAGSDSGGGAGIQADLKTFAALGVHGMSAITSVTAQNPKSVRGMQVCRPNLVRDQIEAVFAELRPAAVKTGLLGSAAIVGEVAYFFRNVRRPPPLIVDPVMVSTSGVRLLAVAAVRVLEERLLPLATLVTPNAEEAEVLTGRPVRSVEDLREAARVMRSRYGCAVLIKGGHLKNPDEAVDLFHDGRQERLLRAPRIGGVSLHGAGCTLAAAIAAYCARGRRLPQAVALAKEYLTRAIARCGRVQGHDVLDHFPNG